MYRQRNFLTVIGGILLFIFTVNNLFMDAVNTAENLKHLTSWGKQSGLDAQILYLFGSCYFCLMLTFP